MKNIQLGGVFRLGGAMKALTYLTIKAANIGKNLLETKPQSTTKLQTQTHKPADIKSSDIVSKESNPEKTINKVSRLTHSSRTEPDISTSPSKEFNAIIETFKSSRETPKDQQDFALGLALRMNEDQLKKLDLKSLVTIYNIDNNKKSDNIDEIITLKQNIKSAITTQHDEAKKMLSEYDNAIEKNQSGNIEDLNYQYEKTEFDTPLLSSLLGHELKTNSESYPNIKENYLESLYLKHSIKPD
jgi:hypothetical protein